MTQGSGGEMLQSRQAVLDDLQDRIGRIIERRDVKRGVLPFGVAEIDAVLPRGGLIHGGLHEVAGGGDGAVHGATSALFVAGIAARTTGTVIWGFSRPDIYGPALHQAGLDLNRVIMVESSDDAGVLDVCETALRFGGLAAVVGEVGRFPMPSSRRIQLAAEESGVMSLIIRRWRRPQEAMEFGNPTASVTKWRVTSVPSTPLPVPGIGRPRWLLELMRQRSGGCADFTVEACDEKGRMASVMKRAFDAEIPSASDSWDQPSSMA